MAEYQFFSTEDLRDMKARGWDYKLYSEDDYLGYVFTIQDKELSEIVNAVGGVASSLFIIKSPSMMWLMLHMSCRLSQKKS